MENTHHGFQQEGQQVAQADPSQQVQQAQNAQPVVAYEQQTQQPVPDHAQEDVVQDPLDVHHEMHIAETGAANYQQDNY